MGKILPVYLIVFIFFSLLAYGQTEQEGTATSQQPFVENPLRRVHNPVQFYPNPSDDFLMIDIDDKELKNVEIEVYNIIGNVMKVEVEDVSGSISKQQFKINVRSLSSGYYLLVVNDKESRFKQAYKFQKK